MVIKYMHIVKKITINFYKIFLIIMLIISSFKLLSWKNFSNKTKKQIEIISQIVNIETNDNIESDENVNDTRKSNSYWDYVYSHFNNIDFEELKLINQDVKGWLCVKGTNINYPFVQASDNKYYLKHSFDKSYNTAGWLFLDYRNNLIKNKNTILYAHGRTDKTMFGTLRNTLSKSWLTNKNNHIVTTLLEKKKLLNWQIFSVYHIKTTSDYLTTDFNNDNEYQTFLNMLLKRSIYNFNVKLNINDKIITLSTCYNTNEKLVLHAKLIS